MCIFEFDSNMLLPTGMHKMWNKSLVAKRRKERIRQGYDREIGPPSVECLSFTHDKDYTDYKVIPPGKEQFAKGWCPPPGKEHIR